MPRNPTNVEVTMSDQATNRADVGLDLSPKIGFLFIHKSWVLMENLTEKLRGYVQIMQVYQWHLTFS